MTEGKSLVAARPGRLDWTCEHADEARLVPEGEDCPACGKRNRPPWSQELTKEEAEEMLADASIVGGAVKTWAVNVFYVQRALADKADRLALALDRIISRYPRGCGVIHGNAPKGWTCLDRKLDAELNADRYGEEYRVRLAAGEGLCDPCIAREALGDWHPHPSFDEVTP